MTLDRWSPLAEDMAKPEPVDEARSRRRPLPSRRNAIVERPRVLVVDDDPQVLGAHVRALRQSCAPVAATSAAEAVAMLEQSTFDVLLTDHDMPGPSGSFLLEAASRLAPSMRRVLVSGADSHLLRALVDCGLAHTFVCKPAKVQTLLRAVELS